WTMSARAPACWEFHDPSTLRRGEDRRLDLDDVERVRRRGRRGEIARGDRRHERPQRLHERPGKTALHLIRGPGPRERDGLAALRSEQAERPRVAIQKHPAA